MNECKLCKPFYKLASYFILQANDCANNSKNWKLCLKVHCKDYKRLTLQNLTYLGLVNCELLKMYT